MTPISLSDLAARGARSRPSGGRGPRILYSGRVEVSSCELNPECSWKHVLRDQAANSAGVPLLMEVPCHCSAATDGPVRRGACLSHDAYWISGACMFYTDGRLQYPVRVSSPNPV